MFRLIPTAQDFSICLRCQYRLGVRQGPRHGRGRTTGHPQQHQRFTSGTSPHQDSLSAYDAATDGDILGRAPIRYLTEEPYPNQQYRHKNELSIKDSLGLNVLGEPAEVLILRDKARRFELDSAIAKVRASGPDKNPASEPLSSSEMLEKIDAERGILNLDEACKNIESVRASWAAKFKNSYSKSAYKDLASRLQKGFTKQQFGFYLNRARNEQAIDVFNLHVDFSNSVYARSSWQPVDQTPKAPVMLNKTPRILFKGREAIGRDNRRKLSKAVMIKKIITQCWNIKSILRESSSGVLDIGLQLLHLKLILKHKRDILKLMSRSYDAKVEVWPRAPIIRITSDYGNCVDIVKILSHTLENIKVATIDLDVESMQHQGSMPFRRKLDDAVLRQIEEYTNTLVEPQDVTRKALLVYYLGPDDTDLLETRRLIHQILRPASKQTSKLVWSRGDESCDASPVPVIVGERLSILDRNQEWSRWCSPSRYDQTGTKEENDKNSSSSSSAGQAAQAVHGIFAFDAVKSFFGMPDDSNYKLCRNSTPHWTPEVEYHDSVKLGQILFPTKSLSSIAKALRNPPPKGKPDHTTKPIYNGDIGLSSSKHPREFVPLVPGLVHSLESLGSLEKSEEIIQVRLSPSVDNKFLPVPVKALPDLEISISFDDESKTTSIKSVGLVTRQEKDFLQPQDIVDLRFIREQRVYARDDSIDPRITSFVQNSNFNIWGEELLRTPLGLSLSIPALAIQPYKGFEPEKHDTLLAEYTSLSLEIKSSLIIPYQQPDSWPTLTYTNIEAGRVGGRRDEISLDHIRFTSKILSPGDPDPSAANAETESLSHDDHTAILFQKTAAVIENIEQMAQENADRPRLQMLEARRWRHMKSRQFRKISVPLLRNQPGNLPPINDTIRKVNTDATVRTRQEGD